MNATHSEPPADEAALGLLVGESPFDLPHAYLEFLRRSNGWEGEMDIDPGYLILWKAEEVNQSNRDYEVSRWAPEFWGFGSNGGGELMAFDFRRRDAPKICMIPMIGMEPEAAIEVAPNFESFTAHLLSTGD